MNASNDPKSLWRQLGRLLFVGLSCIPSLMAQETRPFEGGASYLLRLERLRRDHDSCVLVQSDGKYHLEILYSAKTRILEGILPPDELRDLERMLLQDKLFQLQQSDIHAPLIQSGVDQFFVSILRPNHWQNLSFPSAESRDPFRDTLEPLLKWLDEVQKKKARPIAEELARNNCLPPGDIQLKQRSGVASATSHDDAAAADQHAASPPAYTFRIITDEFGNNKAEVTCLIVFDPGTYHRIRQSQKFGSKQLTTTVLDGSFSPDDLHSLRAILDADELKNYTSDSLPRQLIGPGTVIHLSIPRTRNPQQITLWKLFDIRGLGAARMPGVEDHGTKLVKPLNEWLKAKLPEKNEVASSNPANPKCLPQP